MAHGKFRWLTVGALAGGEAGLLTLTAMMHSAFAYGAPPLPPPIPDITEVMGGSGNPIPGGPPNGTGPADYLTGMTANFINPNLPGTTIHVLPTPEELYPMTGIKALPLDKSVSEGLTILNDKIGPELAAGTPVGVFGYSQSTIIASEEMEKLDPSGTPSDLPARFVLAADLMNPNGGLLERFHGLQVPAFGLDFSGATPGDDFPTTIYTAEYDGFADFPKYPLNFLADLNAVAGIIFVHPKYDAQPSGEMQPIADGGMAVKLPTQGATETTYYMVPTQGLDPVLVHGTDGSTYFTENLPLLEPLFKMGGFAKAIADLIQPDLRVLVNLGYDNPNPLEGWDAGSANTPTGFDLFPSASQLTSAMGQLIPGAEEGFKNFLNDLFHPSAAAPDLSSLFTDPFATVPPAAHITSISDFFNALSSAASSIYSTLLPAADSVNALLTSIPGYDISLFLSNLSNPLLAFGLPIAADTGLVTVVGGVDLLVLLQAAAQVASAFGL